MKPCLILAATLLSAGAYAQAERAYLRSLASDTWRCIGNMVDPNSGLPYDNSDRGEYTSVSNIGIYLSCVVAAQHLGLIDPGEANRRLDRTFTSLEKLQTWFGFQQCWNSVKTLKVAKHDPWISVLDTGNLLGGLVATGQANSKFKNRAEKLVAAMDWSHFYDPTKVALYGGFNTNTGKVNPDWHIDSLGTDAQLAQFMAVASGKVTTSIWDRMVRSTETRDGATYLAPGWQGGGLFMQFIAGIWLDRKGTLLGLSAENFAYAQIQHAKTAKLAAWGWSACSAPDGTYAGWGKMTDPIVTPHASVLAIESFLQEVMANLKKLEEMGARSTDQGFYDSIDLRDRSVGKRFLILDQGMLFLSLANYLDDRWLRKQFQADPKVQRARKAIRLFQNPVGKPSVAHSLPSG